ncbi:MAG: aldehyde dehydrogenase family protein, partial [Deltaproteobacteria bacterium]|nr:aldehyde dehydrogenase family protein [Deltaproteobacteria bacterium]
TGMTSAAIVAGNTVVLKPSSQTPVMACVLSRFFRESGLPDGVLNILPGTGEKLGDALLKHPKVALVVFTGSKEVGLGLIRKGSHVYPGQRIIRRVIAELGGKNAIILDESGDPDQAVIGITQSAFGYSGQKCSAASRVILLDTIYDQMLERIVERARSLAVGPAEDPATTIGPLISEGQLRSVQAYVDLGKREAKLALEAPAPELAGNFMGPVVFYDVPPAARIAREEIFGPVLSILRAKDFDEAIAIANETEYALTAGLYSRTPSHIRQFRREVEAGNRYINTKITGAVVERQPFGGYKLSGIGSKAGGAHYLNQFMIPISVSENVTRHGFAPLSAEEIE